ncbi:MAG: hypothetical protein ACRD8U_04485 [Pyrinomonadaceae bacterium]
MYTNVNLAAPIGALAFLGTGLLFLIAGLLFLYTVIKGELAGTKVVLSGAAVLASVYVGLLIYFSLASTDQVLARGQEKNFCEIDCHLAYSVVDVQIAKTLGYGLSQATARGLYHVVTIKTRFDGDTISSTRGDLPLKPNSRITTVLDDQGRRYLPSTEGERALTESEGVGVLLTTPLRPGETYTTKLVFDLPTEITSPTLLVNEGEWITHFIIGHENSPLHKKTRFQLDSAVH